MAITVQVVDQVTEELVEAFRRLVPQLSSLSPMVDRATLEQVIDTATNSLLIARGDADEILGTLTLVVFRIPTGFRAWIEDVVVDEKARGRGVGEALTLKAIAVAKEHGARTLDLTSRPEREAANRLYQRLGFSQRATNVFRLEF